MSRDYSQKAIDDLLSFIPVTLAVTVGDSGSGSQCALFLADYGRTCSVREASETPRSIMAPKRLKQNGKSVRKVVQRSF